MISRYQETDTIQRYYIPKVVEREDDLDTLRETGTVSSLPYFDKWFNFDQLETTEVSNVKLFREATRFVFYNTPHNIFFWKLHSLKDITKPARIALRTVENKEIAEEAYQILNLIDIQLAQYSEGILPPIRAVELEDGSLLIEWVFNHFRVGFNIEIQRNQSGYFLISDDTSGMIRSSGYLEGLNLDTLIRSLLILVLNN